MFKTYTGSLPDLKTIQIQTSQKGLQRTEEWFESRRGSFTGFDIDKLMGCTRAMAKAPWGTPEKLIHFNETVIKYIYTKAMERKHGVVVEIPDNLNFKYGRKAEPIIVKIFINKRRGITFKEMPYIAINEYLGASPDGNCIGLLIENGVNYAFEAKGAMNWGTFYARTEMPLDQKHMDFWQCQTEMLALKTDKLYYCTSYPVKNAISFINSDDEEAGKMIKDISTRVFEASPIHQKAILQRAEIGNNAINLYLEGMDFHEAIQKACSDFEIETY